MKVPALTLALSIAALLCVPACSEDATVTDRVVTFNVGLAVGYVPEAPQRIDPIVDALVAETADVICLQELWTTQSGPGMWTSEVIEDVLNRVSGTYPHTFWERTSVPADAPETGCSLEEADELLLCVEPACGDQPPENLVDCVLSNCSSEYFDTSNSCQGCLATNLGQPLESIVAACRGISRGGVVYDGHNGLAILSRHPILATDHLPLTYALTARSALHASVQLPGAGASDVYCTHLASDLSGQISYPDTSPFASFAEENLAQTDALLAWVDETADTGTTIVMGDFNHGPGGGSVDAELPDSYQRVRGAGYVDPVAELDPPRCTYCDANLLVSAQGDGGEMIDHVYLDPATGANATAAIVFDAPLQITGADGNPRQVNLSDHYGVAVEFQR